MNGKYIGNYFAVQSGACIDVYESENCIGHICTIVGDLSTMTESEFEQEVNDELDPPFISNKDKSISLREKAFIENI